MVENNELGWGQGTQPHSCHLLIKNTENGKQVLPSKCGSVVEH